MIAFLPRLSMDCVVHLQPREWSSPRAGAGDQGRSASQQRRRRGSSVSDDDDNNNRRERDKATSDEG